MARVLLTGGTGLIGKRLSQLLTGKGYEVVILTRNARVAAKGRDTGIPGNGYAYWDIEKGELAASVIREADYIIHLAGAGVAEKRWSDKRKKEILESRTQSAKLLVTALSSMDNKVQAVITASAIGWYGPDTPQSILEGFREDSPPAKDFLGTTCRLWEESIEGIAALGIRLVKLRTGIVLSKRGGALAAFLQPLKAGIAAILGSGKQYISWIHIDDLCRMYIQAMESGQFRGVYNAVAPVPVTNKELTLTLAQTKRGKYFIPVFIPAFLLRLILGEMSVEVLKSAKVSCEKVLETSFEFRFPTIKDALGEIFGNA